jgi:hypothetical protein
MNLDTDGPTIICEKCRYVRITFDPKRRGENGGLIPIEYRTGLKHDCHFSYPFRCGCGRLIYEDSKVVSLSGRCIRLNYDSDTYHYCENKPVSAVKKRGLLED